MDHVKWYGRGLTLRNTGLFGTASVIFADASLNGPKKAIKAGKDNEGGATPDTTTSCLPLPACVSALFLPLPLTIYWQ